MLTLVHYVSFATLGALALKIELLCNGLHLKTDLIPADHLRKTIVDYCNWFVKNILRLFDEHTVWQRNEDLVQNGLQWF